MTKKHTSVRDLWNKFSMQFSILALFRANVALRIPMCLLVPEHVACNIPSTPSYANKLDDMNMCHHQIAVLDEFSWLGDVRTPADSVLSQTGYNCEINLSARLILSRHNYWARTRIYKHEGLIKLIDTYWKIVNNKSQFRMYWARRRL